MSVGGASFYRNFRDPWGLVWRMLRNGDAAHSALLHAGLAFALTPIDRSLELFERRRLQRHHRSAHPVILIVGVPRSGTTLLYQVLCHSLEVTYISNLTALFPRAPLIAAILLEALFKSRDHHDYHSFYGATSGLNGPNDGFEIWNRWLGTDRYRAPRSIDKMAADEMRNFFHAWCSAFDKPFINKNNRNSACIPMLSSTLKNASFIVVRRDPFYVAQSLYLARIHVQGDKRFGWGLASYDVSPTNGPYGAIDAACHQVLQATQQIDTDLLEVDRSRVIEVAYEQLCAEPEYIVKLVARGTLNTNLDRKLLCSNLPPFPSANRLVLSSREADRMSAMIHELFKA